jgi:signal transduction histidine kinase/CheY-like chemotaxis protein
MSEEIQLLLRKLERERRARQQAEMLLEQKSLELYEANKDLTKFAEDLEDQVKIRTDELVSARDEALAATKTKSEFLANMSHEIRTPMNAIIGMTSLLLDMALPKRQREFVEMIRSASDSLLSLINDILDFSKIEAGKLELESIAFDLRECVEEALDLLAPKAVEKGLEIAYQLRGEIPFTIIGDITRLRQILVNLLSNAVKFTKEGEVIVAVSGEQNAKGDYFILFEVKDTGIGIPEAKIKALFQSFSQVDASNTREFGGTGLGLAISRSLTELMGGRMGVSSVHGQGSNFHFSIKTRSADKKPPHEALEEILLEYKEFSGRKALIVDDHRTSLETLNNALKDCGLETFATTSCVEALDFAKNNPDYFDVAILDKKMPEMDGITLGVQLRRICKGRLLPLVILTPIGQWEMPPFASQAIATINKPVKPIQLLETLKTVFGGKHSASANEAATASAQKPSEPAKLRIDPNLSQRIPLKILLTEDNMINQKVATRILDRMGYRADVAANGLESIDCLRRQNYDVVLMDVQMPVMDGLEASRRIRQSDDLNNLYIIAMTANAMAGDREKCIDAGMNDYVTKPIRIEQLQAALEKFGKIRKERASSINV